MDQILQLRLVSCSHFQSTPMGVKSVFVQQSQPTIKLEPGNQQIKSEPPASPTQSVPPPAPVIISGASPGVQSFSDDTLPTS